MTGIQSLVAGLEGQFLVAFIDWILCREMIGYVTISLTPAEAAELLKLITSKGLMIQEDMLYGADDGKVLEVYTSICEKLLESLHTMGFSVRMTLVEGLVENEVW